MGYYDFDTDEYIDDSFDETDNDFYSQPKGDNSMDAVKEILKKLAEIKANQEALKPLKKDIAFLKANGFVKIFARLDLLETTLRKRGTETTGNNAEMSEIERDYRAKLANPFVEPHELENHPFKLQDINRPS